jgi:RNA 2',3'-cyclic 3'-phosphodiesterase
MRPEPQTSWRLFCAVNLPGELKARAAEHQGQLRAAAPQVRASWEQPEKLHLTLKFLGEVELPRVEALTRAAARAAEGLRPFELTVVGTGAFPPRGSPRVLWLGVEDPSGVLARLHARLEEECAREGFAPEQKAFRPHLTLARLRSREGGERLGALHRETPFGPQTFTVSELAVVRSELLPGGARHTPISRHQL